MEATSVCPSSKPPAQITLVQGRELAKAVTVPSVTVRATHTIDNLTIAFNATLLVRDEQYPMSLTTCDVMRNDAKSFLPWRFAMNRVRQEDKRRLVAATRRDATMGFDVDRVSLFGRERDKYSHT
jgi:hypothetical protein